MRKSGQLAAVSLIATACLPAIGSTPTKTPAAATQAPTSQPILTEKALRILVTVPSTGTITVEVRDAESKPVRTDLWFFKLAGATYIPLTGVEAVERESRRPSPNFMLPRVVLGATQSWEPANDSGRHGVMTDGSDRRTIDGRVEVNLGVGGVPPGTKILIAAAIEDQRYYGARVFDLPSGTPGDAPMHNTPSSHRKRTYEADIKPLLEMNCLECHHPSGAVPKFPFTTFRDIVDRNAKAPGGQEFDSELAGAERPIEPGAPALSSTARRTLPGLGAEARKWYGKNDRRWNINDAGNVSSDRRMPQKSAAGQTPDSDGLASYFDSHIEEYKLFYDWVAQGAVEK